MGRKIRSKQKINNEDEVLLSALSYNDVGQLQEKSLHNGMQKIGYSYNERGWMKSMTAGTAMFDQYLRYNDPQQGGVAQWNGNISEQAYTSTHTGSRWFTYGYDKLNRLKTSAYSNANELGYDQMGNISRLIRGGTGNGTLDYAYTGNRLMSLSGFKTGSYVYDDNGNMTTDGVRNVTIGYNALNLPVSVTGTGGNISTASYLYDADGNKQRSVQGTTTRDYIAGIQYENGQISQVMTEEGRAVRNASNNTYRYEYFLKDHLGNTRVTIDDQGGNVARVVQSDEYYAFGLNRSRYVRGDKNNYLYNGKEIQDVLTDQYDYGARFYDPVIGRWNLVDPMAEKYYGITPYAYVLNLPSSIIDPDGRDIDISNLTDDDQKKALVEFLRTKNGQAFIANYLKKGQALTIKIGGKSHVYTTQKDGEFANDLLAIGSSDETLGVGNGMEVVGRTLTTKPDGNELDEDGFGSTDNSYDVRKKVVEQIWLKTGQGMDGTIATLGHEAFVHAFPDINRIRELRRQLNDGTIKPGTKAYEMKLEAITKSGDTDHNNLSNGKANAYNNFSLQMDAVKSTTRFIKAYSEDVKSHKK